MKQYEQFLTADNFKLAFERLRNDTRTLYKSIYYEDLKIFELFLDENIKSTIGLIEQNIYKPEKCYKIFIPKKDNMVRPLSMLTFIDLLVYQALINVIADVAYENISPFYDKVIFGNIIHTSTSNKIDRQFFYKSWKRRWKRFNDVSRAYFEKGYKYLSEFDIASFFDTIDHNILCEILENKFKIDDQILELLSKCLEAWTADSNLKSFKSKHGIPQGPISSPFLADLYLFHLDTEIAKLRQYDFKYMRYVDDIRIFAKDVITSQKIIASLDLLSRDLGLIPQGSKILIKEITNIEEELNIQNGKFSEITKEFKEANVGKLYGNLKSKTHKQLKKRFIDCFNKKSKEHYLDKTVIKFSLYKLNKDRDILKLIIDNYKLLFTHFDGLLFYLRKHFPKDVLVLKFLDSILTDDDLLFHHILALIFKYFPDLPFNESVYNKYTFDKHRHWLVNFYMVAWLYYNNKKELILTDTNSNNYFIQRELNNYKFISSTDNSYRKIFSMKLLENDNALSSLQGLNFLFKNTSLYKGLKISYEHNQFIKYIITKQPVDIIIHTLHQDWKINNPETFFNKGIWSDDLVYSELQSSFLFFIKSIKTDPSKALLNMNAFNNIIFDKFCNKLNIKKPSKDYGVNL